MVSDRRSEFSFENSQSFEKKVSEFSIEFIQAKNSLSSCPRPVLIAQDTRSFMRKSYGPGSKHALSTGMLRLRQLGVGMEWIEKPTCWRPDCHSGNPLIFPIPLNEAMRVVESPGKINVFLCETCGLAAMGAPGREGSGWIW